MKREIINAMLIAVSGRITKGRKASEAKGSLSQEFREQIPKKEGRAVTKGQVGGNKVKATLTKRNLRELERKDSILEEIKCGEYREIAKARYWNVSCKANS